MTTDNELEKYESSTNAVRELLRRWHSASVDVALKLREIELQGQWRYGGHATFEKYLSSEFKNAFGHVHYQHVIRAVEAYGEGLVRELGADCAAAITRPELLASDEKRGQLVGYIQRHVETNKVFPDAEKTRRLVDDVTNRTVRSIEGKGLARESALESENRQLKAKVRELQSRVRELESELDKHKRKPKKRAA